MILNFAAKIQYIFLNFPAKIEFFKRYRSDSKHKVRSRMERLVARTASHWRRTQMEIQFRWVSQRLGLAPDRLPGHAGQRAAQRAE